MIDPTTHAALLSVMRARDEAQAAAQGCRLILDGWARTNTIEAMYLSAVRLQLEAALDRVAALEAREYGTPTDRSPPGSLSGVPDGFPPAGAS